MKQPPRRHRRDQQQPQIVGQKKRRQRGDDAAEGEEGEEGQEEPRQAEPQQVIAEVRIVGELDRDPPRAVENPVADVDVAAAEVK